MECVSCFARCRWICAARVAFTPEGGKWAGIWAEEGLSVNQDKRRDCVSQFDNLVFVYVYLSLQKITPSMVMTEENWERNT